MQQLEGKLEDVCGILSKMYRISSVNIRPTEIQRATLNLQPARAHAATCFVFFNVVKNIFSLIVYKSQFMGYCPSQKDNSRDSLKV